MPARALSYPGAAALWLELEEMEAAAPPAHACSARHPVAAGTGTGAANRLSDIWNIEPHPPAVLSVQPLDLQATTGTAQPSVGQWCKDASRAAQVSGHKHATR